MPRWPGIDYFTSEEFDSPDAPGSGLDVSPVLVGKLDELRKRVGFPLHVNSGVRTEAHNAKVGGVDSSAHVNGDAADVRVDGSQRRHDVLYWAMRLGFARIGIAKTYIHLDISSQHPQNVVWRYKE